MKEFLNVGCGTRFLEDWTNIDFISTHPSVISADLLNGIQSEDNCFEVVYTSHLLEHFDRQGGLNFLRECYRVLKPGGILRVIVPDLEQITKLYIEKLQTVLGDPSSLNEANYFWSYLELYDQTTRRSPGGEIMKYWSNMDIINFEYIERRVGFEFLNFRNQAIKKNKTNVVSSKQSFLISFLNRITSFAKRKINLILNGSDFQKYFELGKFISSGELHLMMYDRYSLTCLLDKVGFKKITVVDAHTSRISNWQNYKWLDVEEGKTRKPDSLFIEAYK